MDQGTSEQDAPVIGHPGFGEWRPIETAPKDGTSIIVMDDRVKDLAAVASWDADEPSRAKWATIDGGYHQDRFTHWMPLPPVPGTLPAHGRKNDESNCE
jgi:hypothetical protein